MQTFWIASSMTLARNDEEDHAHLYSRRLEFDGGHIALHEIGAPSRQADVVRQDDMHARFSSSTRKARSDALIDGRHRSRRILFYLAKRFPKPNCCRATSRPRRRRCPGCRSSPRRCIRRGRGLDYATSLWHRRPALGNGWALGDYSIADIHLFRLYWRLANSLKPAPGTFPISTRIMRG